MKILVRGTNWIGDAVMAIPAIRQLRRIFPDARITLHTRSWAEGIFSDADFIDDILTFDRSKLRIKDVAGQVRVLRKEKFDIAVLLPNSFESALVAKLAGIPKRFGYATDGRSFLLTSAQQVPLWKDKRHEVFYYMNLMAGVEEGILGTLSILEQKPDPTLPVSPERKTKAREMISSYGLDSNKKIVALGVGSTNSRAKRWPAASYAALNDRLQRELGASVILVGGPDEIVVSEEVHSLASEKPLVLTGKTGLAEAAAILAEADMLISNDMGLAHIAPAAGTRTLVIFGPTNPETTRPFSENAEILRRSDVECSPCMLRDCPIDHRCMTRISPDEVYARAVKMIGEG